MISRRKFIVTLLSLASLAHLKTAYPFSKFLSNTPDKDGIIIKNGWVLKESDL